MRGAMIAGIAIPAFAAGLLAGVLVAYARIALYGWRAITTAELRAIPHRALRMFWTGVVA